jgi:hypothetical protein
VFTFAPAFNGNVLRNNYSTQDQGQVIAYHAGFKPDKSFLIFFRFFEKKCLPLKKSVVLLPSLSGETHKEKNGPGLLRAQFIDILKPSSKETYEKPLFFHSFDFNRTLFLIQFIN